MSEMRVPVGLRRPLYGLYAWIYDSDMEEAMVSDYQYYQTMADFFSRKLKNGARPLAASCMVSPADGILHRCGRVEEGVIEQVKGITYTLDEFLGPSLTQEAAPALLHNKSPERGEAVEEELFYCVLYLAPGNYHGFHSPTQWTVKHRRHYAGHLLSVGRPILERVPKLLCLNERVLLEGNWAHGYFSMTAVGATNVGNILIDNDNLKTNLKNEDLGSISDRTCMWPRKKGDKMGEFRMGSSVVLIFQAPPNFRFTAKNGSRIKYGETLGELSDSK